MNERSPAPAESRPLDVETSEQLARMFGALADPTRMRLMSAMYDRERCVHELCSALGLEQSAASHQLRILRDLGLVRRRKQGRHAYYRLDDSHVRDVFLFALDHVRHGRKKTRPPSRKGAL